MTTYRLALMKQVHSCFSTSSSRDVWLERILDLSFPPTVGLRICHGPEFDEQIKELYWNVDEQRFDGYTEEDKTLYDRNLHGRAHDYFRVDETALAEIVAGWIGSGWSLRKRREQS